MLSVFLCHLNRIIPPLWKSLAEHQKCQDQQTQNRLQKKAALLPIPVRDPLGIKMDRHSLRQISPGSYKVHHVPKDHQKTEHICNIPQFFLRHYPLSLHHKINLSADRTLSFLYFTHKLPACKSILQKITLHNNIC